MYETSCILVEKAKGCALVMAVLSIDNGKILVLSFDAVKNEILPCFKAALPQSEDLFLPKLTSLYLLAQSFSIVLTKTIGP